MVVAENRRSLENALYPNSKETLVDLLATGDKVVVWSRDYLKTFGLTGLGQLRKTLPPSRRRDFSILFKEDKWSPVPDLLEKLGTNIVVFVDDEIAKLKRAQQVVVGRAEEFHFLHVHPQPPEAFSQFEQIRSVSDLLTMSRRIREGNVFPAAQITWFIDFNNTLIQSDSSRI